MEGKRRLKDLVSFYLYSSIAIQ